MNEADIRARIRGLDKLAAGLSQESLWRKCNAPVLAVVRQQYMDGINQSLKWDMLKHLEVGHYG